jgi:DNA-binding MarR family transcriptional regulator
MSTGKDRPDGGGEAGEANFVGDWASVVRAVEAVQHAFEVRLEALGISLPYFSVLTLLLAADERRLPMSRIARDLSMTSGGFTKLADRMARDGLIDRRGSSGDRRVVFAALTESGLALAHRADDAYQEFLREQVLGVVTPAEMAELASIAGRLGAALAAVDAQATPFEIADRAPDSPERRSRRGGHEGGGATGR